MTTKRRDVFVGAMLAGGLAALFSAAGCGTVWLNLTKERTGNVSVQFINNTPYRAAFSYGSYDAWDRSPGPVTLQQLAVGGNTTSAVRTLTCRRNVAVATQRFVDRVLATNADQDLSTFNPDQFDVVVHFSDAPVGSEGEFLPTKGTALGSEKLLGVDFSCADLLIFTFVEDPGAPGGFRIDFEAVLDESTSN